MAVVRICVDTKVLENAKKQYGSARKQKMIALGSIIECVKEIKQEWKDLMDETFYARFDKTVQDIELGDRCMEDAMEDLEIAISETSVIGGAIGNDARRLTVDTPYY